MCIGKNRAFQHSDGSCVCKAGYVFYNELDFKSSSADSDLDCQPEVEELTHVPRIPTGYVFSDITFPPIGNRFLNQFHS